MFSIWYNRNNMTYQKQKKLTPEKMIFTALGVYVFLASLLMIVKAIDMWPFIFFAIVSLFSVYALYKILYRDNTRKLLRVSLVLEGFIAIFLLYPAPLALVADLVGIKCQNLLGGTERCLDSLTFSSIEVGLVLMIPMALLAIFSYQKTK